MCASQMVKPIVVQKLLQDFLSENVACTSRRNDEPCFAFLGVAPHQIAERTIMRDFLEPVQTFDLVHRLDERRQSSVNSKNVLPDYGCYGKKVKKISEQLPDDSIPIFVLALHIEAIVLSYRSELVITSYQQYFARVLEFQQAQKSDGLYTMSSSIDVVSQEKIIRVWQLSSDFKYLQDVKKLTVNIAYNCDWY